jgi:hypothetical protein
MLRMTEWISNDAGRFHQKGSRHAQHDLRLRGTINLLNCFD